MKRSPRALTRTWKTENLWLLVRFTYVKELLKLRGNHDSSRINCVLILQVIEVLFTQRKSLDIALAYGLVKRNVYRLFQDRWKQGKAKLVFLKHIRSAGGALGHYKPKTCLLKGILIIHKRKLQSLSSASIFFFLVFGERLIRVSIITCAVQIMELLKHAVNTLESKASYLNCI